MILLPHQINGDTHAGGKAYSLARLQKAGFEVPPFFCLTTGAYLDFIKNNGLDARIALELARRDPSNMRWEEMWDTSLRLKNLFLKAPISNELKATIQKLVEENFPDIPLVIRSSAPGEDSPNTSFAGIHESYVNVRGLASILEHIKLVWASLWSDGAILYRKELGLDIEKSSMAVIVQALVRGERSGIVFSRSPDNEDQMVIESVPGLNEGLVSGDIEPDRWILERETGNILQFDHARRDGYVIAAGTGTAIKQSKEDIVPLDQEEIGMIRKAALSCEKLSGCAQDIEWTIRNDKLILLQSRPITTLKDEQKSWYLSLKRSFDNLRGLYDRIENELIPEMIADAEIIETGKLNDLTNSKLITKIKERETVLKKWQQIYNREFIPFAHGMRLLAEVYNQQVRPDDPYEFMDLLSNSGLMSLQRNRQLDLLADMLREREVKEKVLSGIIEGEFALQLDKLKKMAGDFSYMADDKGLVQLLLEISGKEQKKASRKDIRQLENKFIESFAPDQKDYALELLKIGRASYRLRDDDNIHLGRIEGIYLSAVKEGKRRLAQRGITQIKDEEVIRALDQTDYVPERINPHPSSKKITVRQIQGQPAGKGIITARARVIRTKEDLFSVKAGEVLICDAIDPNMTFVIPLASGIVERRGGMLIHGAIIAREYGLPCVTGIPDAIDMINNGDLVTVDGYLGIVVIEQRAQDK